ncbi:O-antigen ligase [uncultured Ruminococcus sp.]|uniref:O-antigen ligase family protein n=1 Tax=uncultured Ruminococcus sp. TaxID=165186 RepID=UPI0025FA020C|nr:O-antigen ligase family protein [uncultured Ruminococcus sp.]
MAKKEKRVDIPNQGHKHLFGTTEKSDFILNMDFDGAQRMCSRFCMLAIAVVTLILIPAYYTQTIEIYVEDSDVPRYMSDNFIFYAASMVMLAGGVGYLAFNVARQKGLVDIAHNRLLAVPLVVMLLTLVSSLKAASLHDSLLGYICRYDGFLMTAGCFGLFAVAAALSDKDRKKSLADFIVAAASLQSVVGILEVVPSVSGIFKNFFDILFIRPAVEDTADAAAGEVFVSMEQNRTSFGIYSTDKAASGFLTSPHALAAVIAIGFAIALAGAAFDDNKKRRILYTIAAPVMAAAACLCKIWAGVVCICAAAAIVTVIAIVKAAKGEKSALAVFIPVICAGIAAGALFGTGAAHFNDERIIFTDSYVVRSVGLFERYDYTYNITDRDTDTRSIYDYLFGDAQNVISQNPVFGVGADNGIYHISEYSLTMDRCYNEYLDNAMQKGVITLIATGLFLLITLIKGFKLVAAFMKGNGDWVAAASLSAVFAYMVQAWFNTSWFSATYLFFIAAGLCWDISVKGPQKKSAAK